MKKSLLNTLLFSCASIAAFGQTLIQDFNPGAGDGFPDSFYEFNGELYFCATDGNGDNDIYKYDGTTVTLIPDVNTDQTLYPMQFIELNGKLVFTYRSGQTMEGLWEYDGVNTPTLIADLNPGGTDGWESNFTVFNNVLYFCGNDGTNGYELWAYDGTNAPYMVMDINPTGDSRPFCFTEFQNNLYFIANTGTQRDFFKISGSTVSLVAPGNFNGYKTLPEANGKLYMAGETIIGDENSNTLYEYTGSGTPTALSCGLGAGELYYAKYPYQDFNGEMYLMATEVSTWQNVPWTYDYVNPAAPTPQALKGIGGGNIIGNLVYYASDYSAGQAEITRYDGTTVTTLMDLNPSGNAVWQAPEIYNDKLVFMGTDGTTGLELWEYDDPTLSLEKTGYSIEVQLYPNPASDLVQISTDATVERVQFYDLMGNLILSTTETTIAVDGFAEGSYTIRIETENGIAQKRFVKM